LKYKKIKPSAFFNIERDLLASNYKIMTELGYS